MLMGRYPTDDSSKMYMENPIYLASLKFSGLHVELLLPSTVPFSNLTDVPKAREVNFPGVFAALRWLDLTMVTVTVTLDYSRTNTYSII